MADTIITNTPESTDSTMGGIVLVIFIAVVVIGGIFLYQNGTFSTVSTPTKTDTTEINVTIPKPDTPPAPVPVE